MGAGRSRIPRISSNYKPPQSIVVSATPYTNGVLNQQCLNKLNNDCAPKTFEVKIPVAQPFNVPVPVPVPVPKPYPVQIPVAVHVRIPVPVKVPVDCPVPVPIKVAVPKIVPVASSKKNYPPANNQQYHLNKPPAYANIQLQPPQQQQQPAMQMHYPNHFAEQFFHASAGVPNHHHHHHHHHQQQQQQQHQHQLQQQQQQDFANQCYVNAQNWAQGPERVQLMNDSLQDTQNTGKSFENLTTADILGGVDSVDYLNDMNLDTRSSTNSNDQNQNIYNYTANHNINQIQSSSGLENEHQSSRNSPIHRSTSSNGIINNQFTNFMLNSNPVSSQSPPTKIFDASYMAPLLAGNDVYQGAGSAQQQSYDNMNTSFVSSLKTSYQSSTNPYHQQQQHQISSSSSSHELGEPTKSSSSLKTIVKNPSPVTILNNNRPRSASRDMFSNSGHTGSQIQNRKSASSSNHNNDSSDQSLITYRSSRQSSKNKRTSAGADSYLTPPFTPTRFSQTLNNNNPDMNEFQANNINTTHSSRGSYSSSKTAGSSFPLSNSSIRHTVQFQKSSIHNTNTPNGDVTNVTNTPNGTFFSKSSSNRTLGSSGRTSFQTSTSFDPTSITPNSSSLMLPRGPYYKPGGSSDMSPSVQHTTNSNFMQFNKDPNNPNNKDFSYMLFNIKVFRTPKEQS